MIAISTSFLALALLVVSGSLAQDDASMNGTDSQRSSPVKVMIYYESLCPDSRAFIVDNFYPTWNKLMDYMTVTFVPFAKSEYEPKDDTYAFTCHHGPEECVGNTVHACVLKGAIVPEMKKQVNLVRCLMSEAKRGSEFPTKSCVKKESLSDSVVDGLQSCANSNEGREELKKMGDLTFALEKPLRSAPTVTIDGVKDVDAVIDLRKAVCAKITGKKPDACTANSASSLASFLLLPVAVALALTKL